MNSKKVGVVTDDSETISRHFGRAMYYVVYEIQDGIVTKKETRPKVGHHHESGGNDQHGSMEQGGSHDHHDHPVNSPLHENMLSNVRDCEALIAGGMGRGMYEAIRFADIKPYITELVSADEAVQAYIKGTLDNRMDKLH